jgi:hypothetical protein
MSFARKWTELEDNPIKQNKSNSETQILNVSSNMRNLDFTKDMKAGGNFAKRKGVSRMEKREEEGVMGDKYDQSTLCTYMTMS